MSDLPQDKTTGFLTVDDILAIQRSENPIFLTSDKKEEQEILHYLEEQRKRNPVVVDLRMGHEVFLSNNGKITELEDTGPNSLITIEPGSFAQLLTHEKLKIPLFVLAFISMKFSVKVKGLINISGFHVDPGYNGRIVFSVYNAGPNKITIQKGEPIFMIVMSKIGKSVNYPVNTRFQDTFHIGKVHCEHLMGESISPRSLDERITRLETLPADMEEVQKTVNRLNIFKYVIVGLGTALTAALIQIFSGYIGTILSGGST